MVVNSFIYYFLNVFIFVCVLVILEMDPNLLYQSSQMLFSSLYLFNLLCQQNSILLALIFFGKLLKNPIYAILAGEQNAALIG